MKKNLLLSVLCMLGMAQAHATYTTVVVKDSISTNTHWTCDQQYLLTGYVYVTSGATLTIDPGTIIKGDKDSKGSLIIERGAKIMAVGTPTAPIVFTSNQPIGARTYGDWGGVMICGKAPVNWIAEPTVEGGPRSKYGGTDPNDNSGALSYVRIEFPGIAFSPNNEVNGLTLCGVGDATQLDHIQVSYSGDDSYEWFGGSVNAKYLVSYRGWDDDFDNDNGYRGKNQFVFALRDPYAADQSGSKGFESDSYQSGTATGLAGDTAQITKPIFSNCTMVGPLVSPSSTAWDPQFVAGAHIRRGSGISILNSIFMGWPCGILWDESAASFGSTMANINNGVAQFRNNIIAGSAYYPSTTINKDVFYVINGARNLTPTTTWGDTTTGNPFNPYAGPYSYVLSGKAGSYVVETPGALSNALYSTSSAVRLGNPFNLANPNEVPSSTSPVVYGTKTFDPKKPINFDTTSGFVNYNVPGTPPNFKSTKANDAFFTKVNFVGAFAGTGLTSDDWTKGWCNWDPVNTNYDIVCPTNGISTVNVHALVANVYPNPTHQNATVEVSLNETAQLAITLVDITGKTVKTIFAGTMHTGTSRIALETSDVQSGIYFVHIASANDKKVLMLQIAK